MKILTELRLGGFPEPFDAGEWYEFVRGDGARFGFIDADEFPVACGYCVGDEPQWGVAVSLDELCEYVREFYAVSIAAYAGGLRMTMKWDA